MTAYNLQRKRVPATNYLIAFFIYALFSFVAFQVVGVTTATAQGGGGVGSGGGGTCSGGGCSGGWHQTSNGHGWVVYDLEDVEGNKGPTDNFRNGDTWANVRTACDSANAKSFYAYIVLDGSGEGRVYDYPRSWEGFSNRFPVGANRDNSPPRATSISTDDAEAAFNSLPGYGIDISDFSFGMDNSSKDPVAWFCYNFEPLGNARLQIRTSGLPGGASVSVRSHHHTTGDCGANFSINNSYRNCTSSEGNGIGITKGLRLYVPKKYTHSSGAVYQFSGWSPTNHGSCDPSRPNNPTSSEGISACINIPNTDPTNTKQITAQYTLLGIPVTCNISASPNPIVAGSSTTLSWSSSNGTSHSINQGIGSVSANGTTSVSPGSSTTYTFSVSNAAYSTSCSVTVTVQPHPCFNGVSPAPPAGSSNSWIRFTLPNTAPANAAPKSAGSTTTSYGATYDEYKRKPITLHGTEDISPDGGADVDVASGGAYDLNTRDFFGGSSANYTNARVDVDYLPFANLCPYDDNQAQVKYRSNYEHQKWKATTFSHYTCPHGYDNLNTSSGTCTDTVTASCPSGYSLSSGTCKKTGRRTATGACSTSGTGATCTIDTQTPSCPSGYSLSGSSCNHSHSATAHYKWEKNGSRNNSAYVESTKDGWIMPDCLDRTYSVDLNESAFTTGLGPDVEDPSTASMGIPINITFSTKAPTWPGATPRNTMRRASQVTIPYEISQRKNSQGGWVNNVSSSINLSAVNNNRNSSGAGSLSGSIGITVPNSILPGEWVQWRAAIGQSISGVGISGAIDNDGTIQPGSSGSEGRSQSTPKVENWPYFKVFGNDVISGGDFGTCTGNGDGITVRNRGSSSHGSSVQHMVYGLQASINGFYSANVLGGVGGVPNPLRGLTFANSSGYGGNMTNNTIGCLPDYFGSKDDNTDLQDLNSSGNSIARGNRLRSKIETVNVAGTSQELEYYQINGDTQINSDILVPAGSRKIIYVNGNLFLNDNINAVASGFSERDEIPYIMFVAENIIIHSRVNVLDTVLVAEPRSGDTSKGNVWTCHETNASLVYDNCRNRLQINGAVIANNVHFMRSFGSLRDGQQNEGRENADPKGPNSYGCGTESAAAGRPTSQGAVGGTTCAAEVITFSPLIYMVLSQVITPNDSFKYDSFVVLPPNL